MKQIQGKFMLFDVAEVSKWLSATSISRVITQIQNHHTWSPAYRHFTGNNHFALLKGMENSHIERGFAEIAQNLTTFPDGSVALCRSIEKIPAGIKGANQQGLCIEHLGNFDHGGDTMSAEQTDTVVRINALFCKKLRLQPDAQSIIYHHWFDLRTGERRDGAGSTKSCPGSNFFGGNAVRDAETNLYPRVKLAIEALTVKPMSAANALYQARVIAENLNVRNEPSANGTRIKALGNGILVSVYQEKNNWCRIDPTKAQWVSGRYLERVS